MRQTLISAIAGLAALSVQCLPHAVFAAPPPPLTFAVGDQLQISFYEPFDNDAKWAAIGQAREPGPSFYLHDELSGRYTVASDWTISLPIIGNVVVAHSTAAEVETVLARDFKDVVGHPGFVDISIAARTPLYILGSVNNPGVYPFTPDMTPLKLVALAGGFARARPDPQSSIQAIDESATQSAELAQLRTALAQLAVLQAEVDDTVAQSPPQLVGLAGKPAADALVQQAQTTRAALVRDQAAQTQALQSAVDVAQTVFVADQGRLDPTKAAVALLKKRLSSLQSLSHDGLAAQPEIEAAQAAALDSQDRQQEILAAIAADQHQLVLAKIALRDFISDNQTNLTRQIADQQAAIENLSPRVAASAAVIKLLDPQDSQTDSDNAQFSIVRDGSRIAADLSTGLQPGDVLQVEAAQSAAPAPAAATGQASVPAPSAALLAAAACRPATGCF